MSAIDRDELDIDAILVGIGMLIISFIMFTGESIPFAVLSLLGISSIMGIRKI